jgi:hypothetical protein
MEQLKIVEENLCPDELIVALAGALHNRIGKRLNKSYDEFLKDIYEATLKNNLSIRDLGNFQFWFNYFMSGHGNRKPHKSKLESLPLREAESHIASDGYKKHQRRSRSGVSHLRQLRGKIRES